MMASFANADFGSDSDSDDQDFDPVKEGLELPSEEEGSGDEENPDAGSKTKSKKSKKKAKKPGGIFLEDDASASDKKAEDEAAKKEFEQEKIELKEEAEKKKTDDLWAGFLADVGPRKTETKPPTATSGRGLGSLSSMSSKPEVSVVKKPEAAKSSVASIFAAFGAAEAKKKLPEIASEEPEVTTANPVVVKSAVSSIFEAAEKNVTSNQTIEDKKSEDTDESKMKITKVFDFAGEAVTVTKEVDKDSKEAHKFIKQKEKEESQIPAQKRPGGLSSIMGVISGKKPKMGTLDKSKIDWNKFVSEEGIKEELETHNKGKDGYVQKQQFLERADLRRFEIEKAAREKTRKPLNR